MKLMKYNLSYSGKQPSWSCKVSSEPSILHQNSNEEIDEKVEFEEEERFNQEIIGWLLIIADTFNHLDQQWKKDRETVIKLIELSFDVELIQRLIG